MKNNQWFDNFPGAITVTDENAIITDMNMASAESFENYGGRDLIGQDLFDCHPPAAQEKLRSLYQNPEPNVYTTEKNGQKKLIYQTPVYEDGVLIGVVELSLPLPAEVPHFKRD
jgi:transcriptional regulator with PAS, ATPase and Fis domain